MHLSLSMRPAGNAIVFSTYIGGSGYDAATGVGVDSAGNITVTGDTDSPAFPLKNPLQAQIGGKMDAFLLKISAQGGLIYSTFLGGFEDDHALGLAVDADGNAVVCGVTRSTNFWSLGGLRPVYMGGLTDGWVFKMKPDGLIAWATYLGGNGNDSANAVALDPAGDIYVTGDTTSLNFPATAGAMRTVLFRPGSPDAFVTKIKGDGTAFGYSTYLGGTNNDTGIRHCRRRAGKCLHHRQHRFGGLPGRESIARTSGQRRCIRYEAESGRLRSRVFHLPCR